LVTCCRSRAVPMGRIAHRCSATPCREELRRLPERCPACEVRDETDVSALHYQHFLWCRQGSAQRCAHGVCLDGVAAAAMEQACMQVDQRQCLHRRVQHVPRPAVTRLEWSDSHGTSRRVATTFDQSVHDPRGWRPPEKRRYPKPASQVALVCSQAIARCDATTGRSGVRVIARSTITSSGRAIRPVNSTTTAPSASPAKTSCG